MAKKRNPGALAVATGAGMPCYSDAAGTSTVNHWQPLGNLVLCIALRKAGDDPARLAALGLATVRLLEAGG